jgi:CheY-like chemotaxis protein
VAKVLVSNNSELLRHLSAPTFRGLGLEVTVAADGEEAIQKAKQTAPALAIVDAEMPGVSGYDLARMLKTEFSGCRVVLVMGHRINATQLRRVAECGCDEVLIAPMGADELYDVVAIQLGLSRRGSERFTVDLRLLGESGSAKVEGRVSNLSVDGARIALNEPIEEGSVLRLTIRLDQPSREEVIVNARVVWAQMRDGKCIAGASFEDIDEETQGALARLTEWEIVDDTEKTRVVLKGDITEATNFKSLLPAMVGRVDFDLSQIKYMNSLGVREWVTFLRSAAIRGYEFHACSVPFVLQAGTVNGMLGKGTVASFFAPYVCEDCDHQEDRLLQSAAILAAEGNEPPSFTCQECGGKMTLDELPDRYLAFLRGDVEE